MLLKKHFSQADKFTAIKNPLYSLVSRSVSLHVQSSVRVLCTFYIWIQHAVKLLYSACTVPTFCVYDVIKWNVQIIIRTHEAWFGMPRAKYQGILFYILLNIIKNR